MGNGMKFIGQKSKSLSNYDENHYDNLFGHPGIVGWFPEMQF